MQFVEEDFSKYSSKIHQVMDIRFSLSTKHTTKCVLELKLDKLDFKLPKFSNLILI